MMQRMCLLRYARAAYVCCGICFLIGSCFAQKTKPDQRLPINRKTVYVSTADGQELLDKIRNVEFAASRAYLYARAATWLWDDAGKDEDLRWVAVNIATVGISDISQNQSRIPPTSVSFFYTDLLNIVRQHSTEEASRLEQNYPLQPLVNRTEQQKAGAAFSSMMSKYANSKSPRDVESATRLITAGYIPFGTLHGEIIRLHLMKSAELPRVLSATLVLEERQVATIPLEKMFFWSNFYLTDTPQELQARFLSATLNAIKSRFAELQNDVQELRWATGLLQSTLPHMQKVTPHLYPQAASLLANLTPNAPRGETVWTRIKNSSDPLAQTLTEADTAADPRLKRELLESAARLAQQQEKLRLAVDLMTAEKEDRNGLPEWYSYRDDFLNKVIQDALKLKDADTANYAASKMTLPLYHVEGLRKIARHFVEAENISTANDVLSKAVKSLQDAPEGKGKAVSYLRLSVDFIGVDDISASETARAAIKTANNIARPDKDEKGEFSQSLYLPMNETVRAFRVFARKDRAEATALSANLQPKDFKVAATLGIYSSSEK